MEHRVYEPRRFAKIAGAWLAAAALAAGQAGAAPPCADPVAEAVSIQGSVEVQRSGGPSWEPLRYKDAVCPGDAVRARERSRADFVLVNETILRIDQGTRVVFSMPVKESSALVTVLSGAAYFISRTPRRFRVETPFVNAGVEGTEFLVRVDGGQTVVTVIEGSVAAENEAGRVTLRGGQTAAARAGEAPSLRIEAHPADAVQWTLHYPPVLVGASGPGFAPEAADARSRALRAATLLAVGRADDAEREIEAVLAAAPRDASALALRSVIAVARNERDRSLALAGDAVAADPRSVPALIALSYARQARFDLEGARSALASAVAIEPANALARARLAELELAAGDLDAALADAKRAVDADPGLSRTQTVLAFALLAREDTRKAAAAADAAIERDQADPLPRLCLGLARIRQGDLAGGRREIEIAASLDPGRSLVRSYLGKAYFEEKRDAPAASQLSLAKELDPLDPTPHFYDAIRKQAANRPVDALRDLNRSIALNDNRAVYRSRLLLDEDLAARSASLGRIYEDLGFRQLALVEGWASVAADPANGSAHRFLADSYSALPRHEITRVSELLQSQLLQPTSIEPVQPSLAESGLPILAQSGPSSPSFNEFNPMFVRDRVAILAAGVAGEEGTLGHEVVFSGVADRFSVGIGHLAFDTDGFRENADQDRTVGNAFLQWRLTHKTSLQAEYRNTEQESGDLTLRALGDFGLTTRAFENSRQFRAGLRHAVAPGSTVLLSFVSRRTEDGERDPTPANPMLPPYEIRLDQKSDGGEAQYHHRAGRLHLVAGGGHFRIKGREKVTAFLPFPIPPAISESASDDEHSNGYAYALVRASGGVTLTAGASGDFVHTDVVSRSQFDPKGGVVARLGSSTTLRAAAFRTLKRPFVADQTLEPTQVAGFDQFFDEWDGMMAWNFGIAADRKFSADVFAGAELRRRDLTTPAFLNPNSGAQETARWREWLGRAYLYWTATERIALGAEYLDERFNRGLAAQIDFAQVTTRRVPLTASYFHPCGVFGRARATWIGQEGSFYPRIRNSWEPPIAAEKSFWTVDASIGYRLPGRLGLVSVEGRNLLDRSFEFQETDPAAPSVLPERAVVAKVTVSH